MRQLLLTGALTALSAAAPAKAVPLPDHFAYTGVDLSRASVSSRYVEDSNDISLGVSLGYQVNRNLGVEFMTRSLSFNPFRDLFAGDGYYPDQHYGISALGYAPLSEDISIFGRAGIGSTRMHATRSSNSDRNETDPVVGLGLRYGLNRNWSFSLEVMRLTKTEVTLVSAGVRFGF